jgi:transcription termination factor NusA
MSFPILSKPGGRTSANSVAGIQIKIILRRSIASPPALLSTQEIKMEQMQRIARAAEAQRIALGVSDEIANIRLLNANDLIALGKSGIKSLDDLADLASDELLEITGTANLNEKSAGEVIMAARAHWFEAA